MLTPHSFRSRRFAARKVEPTQQLLVFSLQSAWFALPVKFVSKVIALDALQEDTLESATGLILYQSREIPILDLRQRLFGRAMETLRSPYLAIVPNLQGDMVGLPLESQPALRRIPESAFSALSATYQSEGNIRCASALIIPSQEEPPIFLLNLHQVLQPPASLPSGF